MTPAMRPTIKIQRKPLTKPPRSKLRASLRNRLRAKGFRFSSHISAGAGPVLGAARALGIFDLCRSRASMVRHAIRDGLVELWPLGVAVCVGQG